VIAGDVGPIIGRAKNSARPGYGFVLVFCRAGFEPCRWGCFVEHRARTSACFAWILRWKTYFGSRLKTGAG
jgi:hypothetical protein